MNKYIKLIFLLILIFLIPISTYPTINTIKDVEVGFSPGKTANDIVIQAIKEAKVSIDIAIYSFTSKLIALCIIDAQNRGINIRIILDKKSNNKKHKVVTYLINHQVPIRIHDKHAIMHNKFMIVDGHSIETGSFNYTYSAIFRNAENVIYLRNRRDIAKKYIIEFNRLWSESLTI